MPSLARSSFRSGCVGLPPLMGWMIFLLATGALSLVFGSYWGVWDVGNCGTKGGLGIADGAGVIMGAGDAVGAGGIGVGAGAAATGGGATMGGAVGGVAGAGCAAWGWVVDLAVPDIRLLTASATRRSLVGPVGAGVAGTGAGA